MDTTDRSEFEDIIIALAGCTFTFLATNFALMYSLTITEAGLFPFGLLFFIVLALTFALFSLLNKQFLSVINRRFICGMGVLCSLAAPPCLYVYPLGALPITCVGLSIQIFFWANFLNRLNYRMIVSFTSLPFIIFGLIVILMQYLSAQIFPAAIAICSLLSCLFIFSLRKKLIIEWPSTTSEEIGQRYNHSASNALALLLTGTFLGITLSLGSRIDSDFDVTYILLGCAIIVVGICAMVFRLTRAYVYESATKKLIATAVFACTFPLVVFFDNIPVAYVALLAMVSTAYIIVLVDAVVETSSFFEVPLYWVTAREGSMYLLGAGFGFSLIWYTFSASLPGLFATIIFFLVLITLVFQMKLAENNRYPYQDAQKAGAAPFVRFGRSWRDKVIWVGKNFKLSPRQVEVLLLLAKGRNAKHVAEAQCISYSTAKSHIYSTYRKIGVHSQQELLNYIESLDPAEFDKEST
jgi:DNA-binding CsgD family transcriptional regulator